MTGEIATYRQISLINLNSHTSLQRQYLGFLETPQLHFAPLDFEYAHFELTGASRQLPEDFEMPHPIRLGQRMEVFMETALQQDFEILAKNLQIIDHKRTLGEFDFILKPKNSADVIHLEMVYKFYFLRPESGDYWIDMLQGPNGKDHLKLKLKKMRDQQFPLLYKTETQAYLNNLGITAQRMKQHLFFKAQVYIPAGFEKERADEAFVNTIQGNYYTQEQLYLLNKSVNRFYIPFKNDWVSIPDSAAGFEDFDSFYKKISVALREQRSSLFWIFNSETVVFQRHFASWW